MPETRAIPIVKEINGFALDAAGWLCDIWGVLHNGVRAFAPAVDACRLFRARGGRIILVSNAPRPSSEVAAQLDVLRVPRDAYDAILTSGDVTRAQLKAWQGVPTLHIGPARDLPLFEGLDVPLSDAASARRVLCSGLYDDNTETPETYRGLLTQLRDREAPMLCANPDVKVDRGGKLIYCAGAIAQFYAELGGRVTYAGKPHPEIYVVALAMLGEMLGRACTADEVVAVGDGVHTDIPGGIAQGMRTVYVASAIHVQAPLTSAALDGLFPTPGERPTVAMDALAW